ncbi:MAG: hypothetical protein M3R00_04710 [Pseudomonadota bacterium]|nr:hypothetical protein [Pseudomonadota bacterium]
MKRGMIEQFVLNNKEESSAFIKSIKPIREKAGFTGKIDLITTSSLTSMTLNDPDSDTKIVIELPRNPHDSTAVQTAKVTVVGDANTTKVMTLMKALRDRFPDEPLTLNAIQNKTDRYAVITPKPKVAVQPRLATLPNTQEKYILNNTEARTEFINAIQANRTNAGFTEYVNSTRTDYLTTMTLRDPKTKTEIIVELPKNPHDPKAMLTASVTIVGDAKTSNVKTFMKALRHDFPNEPLSTNAIREPIRPEKTSKARSSKTADEPSGKPAHAWVKGSAASQNKVENADKNDSDSDRPKPSQHRRGP